MKVIEFLIIFLVCLTLIALGATFMFTLFCAFMFTSFFRRIEDFFINHFNNELQKFLDECIEEMRKEENE